MSYQQNQPQLPSHPQSGMAQHSQFQQPQLQQLGVPQQFQQRPAGQQQSPVAAQPMPQQGQPTGQIESTQQPAQQAPSYGAPQPMQAASQHQPVQGFDYGVPTPELGGAMTQAPQQRAPVQQFGRPQEQFQGQPRGHIQSQGQLALPQGQFGPPQERFGQPQPRTQPTQTQPTQTQPTQALTAQPGQQAPSQAQWGAQASGQSPGIDAPPSDQSPTGQSFQSGSASLSAQMQGFDAGAAQQVGEQSRQQSVGMPNIDIVDTPDEIVLLVDLPGYEEEDITIQGDGQSLSVSAERREEEREDGQQFAHERPRKLQRTIRLPARANVNEADATHENGVCRITLPKMEEEKQHEIAFQ